MKKDLTGEDIKAYIENMIEGRKATQDKAHEQFNKGVKFATDYVLNYINIEYRPKKPQSFLKKLTRIFWNDDI